MRLADSAVLYYLSHFLYVGHPADMLGKFWLTRDVESAQEGQDQDQDDNPWQIFEESLKEAWRATGVMAALIASAAAALIVTPYVSAHSATLVLLLASITCSIISVSSATSFLSSPVYKSRYLKLAWDKHGLILLIMLSTPSAWLSHALLTFQAALLSLAWLNDIVAVRVVITILIGLRFGLGFAIEISFVGIEDALLGLLGARKDLNHHTIIATEEAIRRREAIRMRSEGAGDGRDMALADAVFEGFAMAMDMAMDTTMITETQIEIRDDGDDRAEASPLEPKLDIDEESIEDEKRTAN